MENGLEFGCGDTPRRTDLDGVDIRKFPGVRYVCNAWEISDHVEDETIPEIYSRHFFEHLTFHQADLTLTAWYKILVPGGLLTIIVPDMQFHIRQWLDPLRETNVNKNGWTDEEWSIMGFWGQQREDGNIWDVHKSGYDFNLLNKTLTKHGFSDIRRVNDAPKNLHVTARK